MDIPNETQVVDEPMQVGNTDQQSNATQSRLTKKRNDKLGFTSGKQTAKKKKMATPVPPPVTVISSSDEEETSTYQMLQDHLIFDLFETVKQNSSEDLLDWNVFSTFIEALYEGRPHPKNHFPVPVLIILHFMMIHNPKWENIDVETKHTVISGLLDIKHKMSTLMAKTNMTMKKFPTFNQSLKPAEDLLAAWNGMKCTIDLLGMTPYEYMPVSCMFDIWENTVDTSRTFVSRQHLKILHNYFKNLDPTLIPLVNENQVNGDSYLDMATTSTSYTSAPIQTQLVAVRGSTEVRRGDDVSEQDLDDEFMSLTSRFSTGKTSLDISLQKDTQSKILKAEVKMEEYVYELKIYK